MKKAITFRFDRESAGQWQRMFQLRIRHWVPLFLISGATLFSDVSKAQQGTSSCGLNGAANCYVQNKVVMTNLSKCATEAYVQTNLPRIEMYRLQRTHVEADYYIYSSGTNGQSGQNCDFLDGFYWSTYHKQWNNTLEEECFRLPRYSTNRYSGSYSLLDESHDGRVFVCYNPCSIIITNQYHYGLVTEAVQGISSNGLFSWKWVGQDTNYYYWYYLVHCGDPVGDYSSTNSSRYTNDITLRDLLPSYLDVETPTYRRYLPDDPITTGEKTMSLEELYSDTDLHDDIVSLMSPYPSDWYEGDYLFLSCAYSVINANHWNGQGWTASGDAELQKMKYRFAVRDSQRDTDYEVHWSLFT